MYDVWHLCMCIMYTSLYTYIVPPIHCIRQTISYSKHAPGQNSTHTCMGMHAFYRMHKYSALSHYTICRIVCMCAGQVLKNRQEVKRREMIGVMCTTIGSHC